MSKFFDKQKQYPARLFNRVMMSCPSCFTHFDKAYDQCPRCGFDACQMEKRFPYPAPVMERMMDYGGVLDDKLCSDLDAAVGKLIKKFPQLEMYFCIIEMDDPVKLTEFGFWMMNKCPLQEGQDKKNRAWSILLLIDVKRGLVSVTPGYAIEAFIEDSGWEEALRNVSGDFSVGNYRRALLHYVKYAEWLLSESSKKVKHRISKKDD